MEYLITLDLGTTSVKTTLFNQKLRSVASYAQEYQLLTPESTVVELEAVTYWSACVTGIRNVITKSGVDINDIVSISLSTQGETLIAVDENGNALTNAIVWLDSRAVDEAVVLKEQIDPDEFFRITGLPEISAASPICKLVWIKNNLRDIYDKTFKLLLLEDYIILKLTNQFVTEPTNMSSTGYYNTRDNEIWLDVLSKAGIDVDKIPKLLPSGTKVGNVTLGAAEEIGLSVKTAVLTGANDQICGAIGTGNIKPGSITETTGTALAVVGTTEKISEKNLYNVTFSRHINDKFIMIAYSQTSGIIYKWFKDNFCEVDVAFCEKENTDIYDRLNEFATPIPRGSDGLLLLPLFAGKLSPDFNENAKGVFYGLNLKHTKAHFIRAIMEGIACMLRENMEIAYELCGETGFIISTGGAAKSPLWSQIKADMTSKEFRIVKDEGASLGAAIIGAVSSGWFDSIEEACKTSVIVTDKYYPVMDGADEYQKVYEKYKSLYKCLAPMFESK